MASVRVLTSFTRATDNALEVFAGNVLTGMTGNAAFPNPPVALTDLQTAKTEFMDALVAQNSGGPLATAVKKNKREALVGLLRKLARYVEGNSQDLTTLLSSNFAAVNTSRAQTPVGVPREMQIFNGGAGRLRVKIKPVPHAKCYELRYAAVDAAGATGPWQSGGLCTNSRALAVTNLTPGTVYAIQVRAIGGSTGASDWCNASSHMSL